MSIITLGGRRYQVIDFDRRTVLQDAWLEREIRSSGVDKLLPDAEESDAEYLTRLRMRLVDSGRIPALLGGFLLPEGTGEQDWTPSIGADTEKHIGRCNTEEDRTMVLTLSVEIAFGFFRRGLDWLQSFQSSSGGASPNGGADETPSDVSVSASGPA